MTDGVWLERQRVWEEFQQYLAQYFPGVDGNSCSADYVSWHIAHFIQTGEGRKCGEDVKYGWR